MTTELTTETQYIPALLWDSLQEVCYKLDAKFVTDVAKLLKVPASDLKRRVLGIRGMKTAITVADGPWWMGQQCPLMELRGDNVWKRCAAHCSASGFCMRHSGFKHGSSALRHKDDPYMNTLTRRIPVRADDEILWACEKTGAVYNSLGVCLPEYKCILGKTPILINSVDLDLGLNNTAKQTIQESPLPNDGTNTDSTE
jgi:hypothetical protein